MTHIVQRIQENLNELSKIILTFFNFSFGRLTVDLECRLIKLRWQGIFPWGNVSACVSGFIRHFWHQTPRGLRKKRIFCEILNSSNFKAFRSIYARMHLMLKNCQCLEILRNSHRISSAMRKKSQFWKLRVKISKCSWLIILTGNFPAKCLKSIF